MKNKLLISGLLSLLIPLFGQAQVIRSFSTVDLSSSTDTVAGDFYTLKNMVGNARIVLLGEPDHESGTVTEAKVDVLKYLHQQMGFDMIAFESGFYDLDQASRDIREGKSVRQALANSIFPIWVNTKEFHPLIEYISKHNDGLQVAGFDNQFSGNYAFENLATDIRNLTRNLIPEAELENWLYVVEIMAESYTFPKTYNFEHFQKQHRQIANAVKSCKTAQSEEYGDVAFFLQLLDNIYLTAKDYHYNNTGKKAREEWQAKDSNVRDSLMAANLIFLAKKYPDKKIVCWGANAHFANQVWKLQHEELKGFTPMGSYLKKEFGAQEVYILGFTGIKSDNAINEGAATIETQLANSGATYGILNIRAMPDGTKFSSTCLSPEDGPVQGEWKGVLDGLFYVGSIKPTTIYTLDLGNSTEADASMTNVTAESITETTKESEASRNVATYKMIKGTGDNLLIVSGKVLEERGEHGIAYANIGIRGTYIGTSSDATGAFTIKVPKTYLQDSVRVSCIGYKELAIAVKDLPFQKIISLTPSLQVLKEVQITSERLTADKIMKRVIKNIKQNYTQEPYTQRRLYKKRVFDEQTEEFYLQEALYDVYDDNGYQEVAMYPIRYTGFSKLLQAREAQVDTLSGVVGEYRYRSQGIGGHLGFADMVDVRNNNFLNRGLLGRYEFEFTDVLETESGTQFLVSFRSKKPTHRSTATLAPISYGGTILINESDYAVVKIDATVIQDKDRVAWSKDNPAYESEKVWYQRQEISYRKEGKYYFMEKLYLTSNWNTRNSGFLEVHGLSVKTGKRERPQEKPAPLPKGGEYNANEWEKLKNSNLQPST